MDIHIGFSWQGLVAFALLMLPSIALLIKNKDKQEEKPISSDKYLDSLESSFRFIYIAMLVFTVSDTAPNYLSAFLFIGLGFLAVYYLFWIPYYIGKSNRFVLYALAITPVLFYIFIEIWLHNYVVMIPTVIFGVLHFLVTKKTADIDKNEVL